MKAIDDCENDDCVLSGFCHYPHSNNCQPRFKIIDKHGVEMPDDWATTPRTFINVKNLLDRLNKNGLNRPYTMIEK